MDTADFAAWVAPHVRVMGLVAARLGPAGDREDVVQDALLDAWRHRETYDPARGSAQAWLVAITARRARRRHGRRTVALTEAADVAVEDAVGDVDLRRAVERLTGRQRTAVELHYFVGLPVAECAAAMGCSEGTVKSTLSDARARLRKELGDA